MMSLIFVIALFAIRPIIYGTVLAGLGIVKLSKYVAQQIG